MGNFAAEMSAVIYPSMNSQVQLHMPACEELDVRYR